MTEKKGNFVDTLKKYRKELIIGVMLILLVVFMIQNKHDVDFNLVFTDMQVPLIVIILFFSGLGAAIVGVYWIMASRDKKRTIKDMSTKIGSLEKIIQEAQDKFLQKDKEA